MTTGILPQRISRRYGVSLVSEAADGNFGEVDIVCMVDSGTYEFRTTVSGNLYRDLRVLMVSGGEAQFDKHMEAIKLMAKNRRD